MASIPNLPPRTPGVFSAGFLAEATRRAALASGPAPDGAHGPAARLLLGELATFAAPVMRPLRAGFTLPQTDNPQVVMLLPGLGTHPTRMRFMAQKLEEAGHRTKRWGLGFNFGPTEEKFAILRERLAHLHDRYGRQVVLVGWSLGGIFAREIAKHQPEHVAKVVTMGSPFSGTPYANNAWRLYQLLAGHAVDRPPVEAELAVKPPVETVALWSPRDGIITPRSAAGYPGERDRAVALRCTHIGFSNAEEAIRAVAVELERTRPG
ncbi:esterase/lipase family protein [Croceibacterium mercuriale]|uniref:esterase/lipase family protein n=1 Tax=Croceibacterium mercuriale TaxID=1572751 RepID=UPI00068E8BA9|nr:alpha/beta fold hydrolase [Croceibacterium mercuriale]